MDINEMTTAAYEFQTSTESDFTVILNGIYEYLTTMNPLDFHTADTVPETKTDELDGIFLFYGLGGILIFFFIYIFIYSYIQHCKKVAERKETELRELQEIVSRTSYGCPVNQDRIISEDFLQAGNVSVTMPNLDESSCTPKPEYLSVKNGAKQKETRLIDLAPIHYRDPQYVLERDDLAKDSEFLNTTVREVAETSGSAAQNAEKPETLGRVESWMSEQPLCFSTPHDSIERIFSPEDSQDLLCLNTAQMEKYESSNECKSDADIGTSTKFEKLSPPKADTDNATPIKCDEKQSPLILEGKSHSSPSSPDIVRRRLTKSEDS